MACYRTDSHGMTLALFHSLIQVGHVPVLPVRLEAKLSRSVGSFDESPFEIVVGLFGRMAIADFATTAFYSRCGTCVTG